MIATPTIAKWIMVIMLSGGSSNGSAPSMAVVEVGPFQSRTACMTAANLALKKFNDRRIDAKAICIVDK